MQIILFKTRKNMFLTRLRHSYVIYVDYECVSYDNEKHAMFMSFIDDALYDGPFRVVVGLATMPRMG